MVLDRFSILAIAIEISPEHLVSILVEPQFLLEDAVGLIEVEVSGILRLVIILLRH